MHNQAGAESFCITDSCTIEPVPNHFCRTDSCAIEPVPNHFCITDSRAIEPVPNDFCRTDSCTIEPVPNRLCITDSCTIEPVLDRAVSNRYGARLFSCIIGPCPIGRAESELCKIVPCLIDTIPEITPYIFFAFNIFFRSLLKIILYVFFYFNMICIIFEKSIFKSY